MQTHKHLCIKNRMIEYTHILQYIDTATHTNTHTHVDVYIHQHMQVWYIVLFTASCMLQGVGNNKQSMVIEPFHEHDFYIYFSILF